MPCWKSAPEAVACWRRFRRALLLVLAGGWLAVALAAPLAVRQAQLENGEEGYELNAEFAVDFPSAVAEAVAKGVTLHFNAEFELSRARWYWFDEVVARRREVYRLSYQPLARQYRLSVGGLHQSFASLDDALRQLGRLKRWVLIDRREVKSGNVYQAALRLELDTSLLPKPFQLTALANSDWDIDSRWHRWTFRPGEAR
jgi:uncharacterized protein DUF4390